MLSFIEISIPKRITFIFIPVLIVLGSSFKDQIGYYSDSLHSESEWDDFYPFPDSLKDPWISVLNTNLSDLSTSDEFSSTLSNLITSFSTGDRVATISAATQIEAQAATAVPAAQSVMGFLYGAGVLRKPDQAKHFMYHSFAADGGDLQSMMVLAYSYLRQKMYEKAIVLYEEVAKASLTGFPLSDERPVSEVLRLRWGTEDNRETLCKSRQEDDEDFLITEYHAQRGTAAAMYKLGLLYYYGLRSRRQDYAKATYWFSKAVEKGDTRAMVLLGEIYVRGAGIERNYTKAFEWFSLAAKQRYYYSPYNALGYLYVKGYGVEKNLIKAKECFQIATENQEPAGPYYLGVLYLKGIGVKRDVMKADDLFTFAALAGQPKALYQIAKMLHKGIGRFEKNLRMAALMFRAVAEQGPWNSLCRQALEAYSKGDNGKALLLYSRMAELGYEVAQSNAAWILNRYEEQSMCVSERGEFCTDTERHLRVDHLLSLATIEQFKWSFDFTPSRNHITRASSATFEAIISSA